MAGLESPSFNATIGAYEIGVLVSYTLFGLTTLQTYFYYRTYMRDGPGVKLMVAVIWTCEVVHAACIAHSLYSITVSNFTHPERLVLIPRTLAVAVLFSGFIGALVQAFFAHRIRTLSHSLPLPALSLFLSFLRLLGSALVCVYGFKTLTIPEFETRFGWLLTALWAITSANDVLIAGTITWCLRRGRAGLDARTVPLIDKLVMWTMETGLLTSAAGLVNLICFVTMKENFIWLACYVVAARLYSNSLLASLNSRVALHSASQKIQNAEFGSMPTSTFQAVHFKSVPAVGSAVTTASGIGDLDERQRT